MATFNSAHCMNQECQVYQTMLFHLPTLIHNWKLIQQSTNHHQLSAIHFNLEKDT